MVVVVVVMVVVVMVVVVMMMMMMPGRQFRGHWGQGHRAGNTV